MPEGVGYGPQYTADVGKGLNYIGDHAWALSGKVAVANSDVTLLEFTTGSNYIDSQFMFFYDSLAQADNIYFAVYVNNQLAYSIQLNQATPDPGAQQPFRVLLPPLCTIKITGRNITDTSSQDIGATMRGTVYGNIEQ